MGGRFAVMAHMVILRKTPAKAIAAKQNDFNSSWEAEALTGYSLFALKLKD